MIPNKASYSLSKAVRDDFYQAFLLHTSEFSYLANQVIQIASEEGLMAKHLLTVRKRDPKGGGSSGCCTDEFSFGFEF
jgi:hypothetical protein